MCVQALPMILSAVGTAATQVNANEARKSQERIQADNLRRNTELNQQAGQRVSQEVQKVAAANPAEEQKTAQNDFMEALRKAKVSDGGTDFGSVPGASDRFAADVGQAREGATAQGKALSGNLAAIDAPQFARIKENRGLTDTATDLSLLGSRGAGQDFLAQLRMARANGNPSVDTLGSGLDAIGNALAQRTPKTPPKKFSYLDQAVNAGVS